MKWLTRSAVMAAVVLLSGASAVAGLTAVANWDGGPAVNPNWEAGEYPAFSHLPPGPGLDWRIGTGEATQAACGYPQQWSGQPYPNSDGVGKWGGALWDEVGDGMLYMDLQNGDAKELVDAQGTIEFWFKPEWDPIMDTNTHTLINLNRARPADDGLWFRYNGDGTMTSVVKTWPQLREVGHEWVWNLLVEDAWNHVAFVWDATGNYTYCNGLKVGETIYAGYAPAKVAWDQEWVGLFFGRDHGDVDGAGTYESDGRWDSFAIWDEVRYSGETYPPRPARSCVSSSWATATATAGSPRPTWTSCWPCGARAASRSATCGPTSTGTSSSGRPTWTMCWPTGAKAIHRRPFPSRPASSCLPPPALPSAGERGGGCSRWGALPSPARPIHSIRRQYLPQYPKKTLFVRLHLVLLSASVRAGEVLEQLRIQCSVPGRAGTSLAKEGEPMIENAVESLPECWHGAWIWHEPVEFMDNFHLLARGAFDLDSLPAAGRCWVTASNIYELWINGTRVGRGPSPSYPKWQYVDSYDVTGLLGLGRNVIAVRCYNFGKGMLSVLHQDPGPGGLLLQLQADDRVILVTGDTWKVFRDPSRRPQTEPISGHRGGFKEVCDGRAEVIGWREADFDDGGWAGARVVCGALDGPWEHLIAREIPPLRLEQVLPVEAFFHTAGRTYGATQHDVRNPEALRSDDETCALVDPLRPDFAPSVVLDFGAECYGYFDVDIADSAGGTMEMSYGESLNFTLVDRYTMRPGRQHYRPFERRGGRYLMLTFRDCPGPVRIRRVTCLRQSYPVRRLGRFHCSDDRLNRIWQVGSYTAQMCMQDHYEDCPWREQTLYCGDMAVSALLSYYAFGSEDLGRKCLRQLARMQKPSGAIRSQGPAPCSIPIIPEYPAFWIISLWNHYWHWGDCELLVELTPTVLACMKWYEDRFDSNGLFARGGSEEYGRFIDNLSNISSNEKLAAEQVIIARAFRYAAGIMCRTGDQPRAEHFDKIADNLAPAIERMFWSQLLQCLIDGLTEGGNTRTQIANGLALLWDVVRPERREALARVLLDRTKAPPMRAGYMNFYMVEALAHAGLHEQAIRRIEEYWGGMIDRGATTFWETFDPDSGDGTLPQRLWSLCHAFCAGPVYSLPAHVAGIKAKAPGFQTVEIAPRLGELHWVRSAVPTPRGVVRIVCTKGRQTRCLDVDLTIPAGTAAEVLVPLPGRDFGSVRVADHAVRCGAEAESLKSIHPNLTEARCEGSDVRLCFKSDKCEQTIHVATTRATAFPVGAVILGEPAEDHWDDIAPSPADT